MKQILVSKDHFDYMYYTDMEAMCPYWEKLIKKEWVFNDEKFICEGIKIEADEDIINFIENRIKENYPKTKEEIERAIEKVILEG
jgi:hypothetical protein